MSDPTHMTPEKKAAYIQAQAACAMIEAMGMQAENQKRQTLGHSVAYDADSFNAVIEKYGIHHNAVLGYFYEN